ncbi:uncharacterized protein LOC119829856 [Zerene cesonia]|uniref:uncharacterized protein LOC119829856 n=1 Tax=Zerene cesonia TaxID=33412 RepID=UPI0018E5506C|nr:uncharacterized protein LOC119829856 [Zerene cesonia]
MFYIALISIFIEITICSHVGSSLFNNRITRTDCWSENDLAKLRARKVFEQMVPPKVAPDKMDSKYIRDILRYFRKSLCLVDIAEDKQTASLLKQALADTIGAHLRSDILPTARLAYYAGFVPYRSVRELHSYYDKIKVFLNTQGLGWKKPKSLPDWNNIKVDKIQVGVGKFFDPCNFLVTKRDTNSCIHLPPPKIDDHNEPSAMALPFRSNGLLSLTSPKSEDVLLKYYTTASRCLLRRSPDTCRHTDFVSFNNEIWHWMKRDVAPHLVDEKLYAAYGGVLRIAAAAQNYGKGLSRRNLFAFQDAEVSKWQPWKRLRDSYVYLNTDWTPYIYIVFILLVGVAICLLQLFYSYIFGDDDAGCHCKGRPSRSSCCKDVAYANVESNIPAMLPRHKNNIYYVEEQRTKRSVGSKIKTSSLSSTKTQRVYDLNENKEKLMDVILSEKSDSSDASIGTKNRENKNIIDVGRDDRSKSPPKIETSVDEVKVLKRGAKVCPQMYSTTTATRSVTYREEHATESVWSESESSSSEQSVTSDSSKSRCRRSRSSRDLAWARRVISKHSLQAKSTSATELDVTSFTTPPSRR